MTCRTDGTAQNCVEAADGAGGPKCESLKVGVCCDAFQKQGNCLTASGSSCASYGPAGETPLTAYCCDQLDIPACKPVSKASDCKARRGFCCCGWFKAGACCLSVKQVPRALVAMTAPRLDLAYYTECPTSNACAQMIECIIS